MLAFQKPPSVSVLERFSTSPVVFALGLAGGCSIGDCVVVLASRFEKKRLISRLCLMTISVVRKKWIEERISNESEGRRTEAYHVSLKTSISPVTYLVQELQKPG